MYWQIYLKEFKSKLLMNQHGKLELNGLNFNMITCLSIGRSANFKVIVKWSAEFFIMNWFQSFRMRRRKLMINGDRRGIILSHQLEF